MRMNRLWGGERKVEGNARVNTEDSRGGVTDRPCPTSSVWGSRVRCVFRR